MFSSSMDMDNVVILGGTRLLGVGSVLAWNVGKSFHPPPASIVPASTITGITN